MPYSLPRLCRGLSHTLPCGIPLAPTVLFREAELIANQEGAASGDGGTSTRSEFVSLMGPMLEQQRRCHHRARINYMDGVSVLREGMTPLILDGVLASIIGGQILPKYLSVSAG